MKDMTIKKAQQIVKEWYPKNSISIDITLWYWKHSDTSELKYRIYIDTCPSTSETAESIEKCLEKVRPNTLTLDEQFDILEEILG